MRGWSRTEIAQKEPAHGYQWSRDGHPCATPQEQAQVKSEDRRAKIECQNREEWGYHATQPKRDGKMERGQCENQSAGDSLSGEALVEQEADVGGRHCREGQRVDRETQKRTTRRVCLSKTIAAEEEH